MILLILLFALAARTDTPAGCRVELEGLDATLFVPEGYEVNSSGVVDILMHLHGSTSVIEPAIKDSGLNSVLIAFNRKGLSKVYAEPFTDPALFNTLLNSAISTLKAQKIMENPKLGRVVISSFSAGFGGVRAMIKVPATFARIDGLIMADSIYCGYTGDPANHTVDPALMGGFRRFAIEAAEGRKTFLLTHSAQVPEGYASTTETANFLIQALGSGTIDKLQDWGPGLTQTRDFKKGKFSVLGFSGKEAADHMAHLRRIGPFWKRYCDISDRRGSSTPPSP